MTYIPKVTQNGTKLVTNRYKVTEHHDKLLREIEQRIGVAPSMVVRLALDILLPRIKSEAITDIDKALDKIFNS
jgi:hypothetical protein